MQAHRFAMSLQDNTSSLGRNVFKDVVSRRHLYVQSGPILVLSFNMSGLVILSHMPFDDTTPRP